jgi:hypothetical protein
VSGSAEAIGLEGEISDRQRLAKLEGPVGVRVEIFADEGAIEAAVSGEETPRPDWIVAMTFARPQPWSRYSLPRWSGNH